jgi:hypothetical protein
VPVRLLRELHCRRPDVVHTHGYPLGYVLPAWLASRRSVGVHTVHTLASRETRPGPSPRRWPARCGRPTASRAW